MKLGCEMGRYRGTRTGLAVLHSRAAWVNLIVALALGSSACSERVLSFTSASETTHDRPDPSSAENGQNGENAQNGEAPGAAGAGQGDEGEAEEARTHTISNSKNP